MLIKSLAELKLFSKSLELIREVSQPCYTILGVLVPKIQTYLALYCFSQNENDVIAYFKYFFRYKVIYNFGS